MSTDTYGMNSSEVQSYGKTLQANAADFKRELTNLNKANAILEQVWSGAAAKDYFVKWEEKKISIKKLCDKISQYADATAAAGKVGNDTDNEVRGMMH